MTTDDKIRDEKIQYDVNWEAAKISTSSSSSSSLSSSSSGKINKYEYLTGKEYYLLEW